MADGTIRIDIDLASKTAQKEYERLVDTLENKSDEYTDTEVANMQRRRNELQKTIDQAKKLEDRRAMIEQEEKIWGSLRLEIIEAQKALEEFEATKPKTMTGEERGEFSKQRAEMQENITLLEKQAEESKKIVDTWSEVNDEIIKVEHKLWSIISQSTKLGQETQVAEVATENLNKETAKIGRNYDKGLKSVTKYAMALFSVRSAYTLLSRLSRQWLNSTNVEAQKTSAMLQQMSSVMSNILAPVIQTIVNALWQMFSLLNSIIKLFFGVDLATKGITKNTKATGSALKQNTAELKKQLAGFDEVNKLTKDDGSSGGGGGIGGMEVPTLGAPTLQGFEKLRDIFKEFVEIMNSDIKPRFLNAVTEMVMMLKPHLQYVLDNLVIPLFEWFMLDFVPAGLNLLIAVLELMIPVIDNVLIGMEIWWEAIKPIFEWLGDIAVGVIELLTGSIEWLTGVVKEDESGFAGLLQIVGIVIGAFLTFKALVGIVGGVVAVFTGVLGVLSGAFSFVWGIIKGFVGFLAGIFSTTLGTIIGSVALLGLLILALATNFEQIKNDFLRIIKQLLLAFQGLMEILAGIFTGDWSRILEGAKQLFSNFANALSGMFKFPINVLIDGLNAFISGLNKIKIPSWVPLVGGKGINISPIRRLNTGTIISRPITTGNTVLAEGGREALLPLDSNTGWIDELADKLANSTVQTINLVVDGSVLAKVVNKQNEKEQFRTGVVYG